MEESRATDVQPHTSTLTATRFFRPLAVSTNFQEPATLSFLDCLFFFARTNFVLSFAACPSLTDATRALTCSTLACFFVSICCSARPQLRRRWGWRGNNGGRRKEARKKKWCSASGAARETGSRSACPESFPFFLRIPF